jgi:hypothetical protein
MASNQIALVKLAVNVVASASVWKVVNDVIRNNVAIETTADAVKVWTGSLVIGSMVADQAQKHVNYQLDRGLVWLENRKDENRSENPPDVPIN